MAARFYDAAPLDASSTLFTQLYRNLPRSAAIDVSSFRLCSKATPRAAGPPAAEAALRRRRDGRAPMILAYTPRHIYFASTRPTLSSRHAAHAFILVIAFLRLCGAR